MKIQNLISELQAIQAQHGDIEVYLQSTPEDGQMPVSDEGFVVIAEEYPVEDGGWAVNLRTWPY